MQTRLELIGGGSRKFWEVSVQAKVVTVHFGRIGTAGRGQTTKFPSDAAARAEAEKMVKGKLGKGYRVVEGRTPANATAGFDVRAKLQALVPRCFEAQLALERLQNRGESSLEGVTIDDAYGKPCRPADIVRLEKRFKTTLPPSYRAYLSLYGHKDNDDFPLGAAQHLDDDIEEALDDMDGLFEESGKDNPIAKGAIPFLLSPDLDKMVLLVPPAGADGELAVVDYDGTKAVQRFRSLVEYFEHELESTLQQKPKPAPRKSRSPKALVDAEPSDAESDELSVKQAVEIILAGGGGARSELASIALRRVSVDEIYDVLSVASAPRFVTAIRAQPTLSSVAEALGAYASECVTIKQQRSKARPLVELLLDAVPAKPKRGNSWLRAMNDAINYASRAKERELAVKLAEVASPYASESDNLPHNAACAFAAVGRLDDALAMCRIAVRNKYADLARMRTDRDLGALLKSPDFQALFTGKATSKSADNRARR